MKRVVVHIDRLVLKGFRHECRHAIADGLQKELARWLAELASAAQLAELGGVSQLQVGNVQIPQGAKAQCVGTKAARGIAGGIKS